VIKDVGAYAYDPNLLHFPNTVPVVCSGKFLGEEMGFMVSMCARDRSHSVAACDQPKFDAHHYLANKKRPILAPYFAAGFAFMPARAVRSCRYAFVCVRL
jgi:hypothetical protein